MSEQDEKLAELREASNGAPKTTPEQRADQTLITSLRGIGALDYMALARLLEIATTPSELGVTLQVDYVSANKAMKLRALAAMAPEALQVEMLRILDEPEDVPIQE